MHLNKRRRRNETSNSARTGQLMNLSLFIMLLAFFIVLNALSSYQENRVENVVDSVQHAFAKDVRQEDFNPSIMPDPANSVNEGDTLERINALFQAQIRSYDKTMSSDRGIMLVKLPFEKFVQSVMAVGQKDPARRPLSAPAELLAQQLCTVFA